MDEQRPDVDDHRDVEAGGLDDHHKTARLQRMGAVIRLARRTLTQEQLGEALGNTPQTTISRWEKGTVELSLEQTRSIEMALDLPLGALGAASGYFDIGLTPPQLEELLDDAPMTTSRLRRIVGQAVEQALRAGQSAADTDGTHP